MHNYDGKSSMGDASSFNASSYYGNRNYNQNYFGQGQNQGYNNRNNNNNQYGGYKQGQNQGNTRQIGTLGSVNNDNSSVGTGNAISLFSK